MCGTCASLWARRKTVLMLLPVKAEISEVKTNLITAGAEEPNIFILHSELSEIEIGESKKPISTARAVLCTYYAEKAVTIEDIDVVLDSSLCFAHLCLILRCTHLQQRLGAMLHTRKPILCIGRIFTRNIPYLSSSAPRATVGNRLRNNLTRLGLWRMKPLTYLRVAPESLGAIELLGAHSSSRVH